MLFRSPPPSIHLQHVPLPDDITEDYPVPPLPQPLFDTELPDEYSLSRLPQGLLEGTSLPSKLTGHSPEILPGTLSELPPISQSTPKNFPSAMEGFHFANVEGPVATRVIFQPSPPKVQHIKNVTIQLKFWVRPDGRVGNVIPMQKGDAALERLAIEYLQKWRFSPLPSEEKQVNQWGLITFTFRTKG